MLSLWLPLNGNTTQQGVSSSTVSNVTATVDNSGKIGKCYSFSGSQHVAIPEVIIPSNTTAWSFACWFYLANTTSSSAACLFSERTGGNAAGYTIFIYPNNSSMLVDDGARWQVTPMTFTAQTWYHLVVTRDSTGKKIYINGELKSSTTTIGTTTSINSNGCLIGKAQNSTALTNGDQGFIGKLNDVRVYVNHALSPREIELLSRGLVCHYPLNGGGRGGDNLLIYSNVTETNFTALKNRGIGTWNKLSLTTKDGYDCYLYDKSLSSTAFSTGAWYLGMKANTTYTYSAWIYFTASANFNFISLGHFQVYNSNSTASDKSHEDIPNARICEPSTIPANKWTKIRITFTTNNLANSYFQVYPRYNIGTNVGDLYFRDMKLEEGNHTTPWIPNSADTAYSAMGYDSTTEYDVSGNGYNGTKNGTLTYSSDTARYSVSTVFDGNSASIQIPNLYEMLGSDGSASYSISVWTYKSQIGTKSYQTILGGSSGFEIEARNAAGTDPEYVLWSWGKITAPYEFNKWNHMVFTKQASEVKLYVNGVLANQGTSSTGIVNSNYFIGAWNTATQQNYEGQMSDFRIYATALSAAQVAELYNTAVSVANNGALLGYELVEG